MSGGSYNYLCYRDADELMGSCGAISDLKEMRDDLKRVYPASRAAKETDELVRLIGHFQDEIERRAKLLRMVWHAQEWYQSADYGKDSVDKIIEDYE